MAVVTGTQEVVAAFGAFKKDAAQDLRATVARAVGRIEAGAKARCPVGTGVGPFSQYPHVRDQIMSQMVADQPSGAVWVEPAGSVLPTHKSPTVGGQLVRPRLPGGKLGRLRWFYGVDNRALWIEYGTNMRWGARGYHGRMASRPFMRPAAEAERPRLVADLQAALDRAARRF